MRFLLVTLLLALLNCASAQESAVREFEFSYIAVYKNLTPGAEAQMWAPLPQSSDVQRVSRLEMSPPMKAKFATDQHGNRVLYMKGQVPKHGRLTVKVKAKIRRHEWKPEPGQAPKEELTREYLDADKLVPISGQVLELIEDLKTPDTVLESAQQLYRTVLNHMSYDKSKPGYGTGDSVWACNSQTGNCTDFHSLFISLARSRKIPARFEIGYPLSAEDAEGRIAGYHCWASFWEPNRGWVPVDISEADKDPSKTDYFFGAVDQNRVSLSTGRDLVFDPPQKSAPLNYFVRPLLEVEGKKIPLTSFDASYSEG